MALNKVKEYLKKYNLDDRIMEFTISSATVLEAATALNCKEGDIAKTLSFWVNEEPILIVMAGDQKIDNAKYKKEFKTKAKMIMASEVEQVIGHGVGGVCPFGVNEGIKVYLDNSLKDKDYVYPACGSCNSAIKLSIRELEETSNYLKWIDVGKEK